MQWRKALHIARFHARKLTQSPGSHANLIPFGQTNPQPYNASKTREAHLLAKTTQSFFSAVLTCVRTEPDQWCRAIDLLNLVSQGMEHARQEQIAKAIQWIQDAFLFKDVKENASMTLSSTSMDFLYSKSSSLCRKLISHPRKLGLIPRCLSTCISKDQNRKTRM